MLRQNKTERTRPKALPDDMKDMIARRALQDDRPREEVAKELIDELADKGQRPPKPDTLKRMISAARNQDASPDDEPWQLSTFDTLEYNPVPASAIPAIVRAMSSNAFFGRMTIRLAKWLSRLHDVIRDEKDLYNIVWHYAYFERISELAHTSFDTTEFDRRLGNPKELIKYFLDSDMNFKLSYKEMQRAFKESTGGVELAGIRYPVDYLVFTKDAVRAPIGEKRWGVLPANPEEMLDGLKKNKLIRKMKRQDKDILIVVLKQPIEISFESQEINERLYNILKGR